jgi:hypothetical protein
LITTFDFRKKLGAGGGGWEKLSLPMSDFALKETPGCRIHASGRGHTTCQRLQHRTTHVLLHLEVTRRSPRREINTQLLSESEDRI